MTLCDKGKWEGVLSLSIAGLSAAWPLCLAVSKAVLALSQLVHCSAAYKLTCGCSSSLAFMAPPCMDESLGSAEWLPYSPEGL